jgi:hypothetical protein
MENDENNDKNENIENNENTEKYKPGFFIELGDIIEIESPNNNDYNDQSFYVLYLDNEKIKLVNISTYQIHFLLLDEDFSIRDESIQQINLLFRNEEKGYARQNKLIPDTWIDIHFGGDIPTIITGQITNLEEDMIEITTFPESQVIYIDFEYKGLPEYLSIEQIIIRDAPALFSQEKATQQSPISAEDQQFLEQQDLASIEYTETGESIIHIPDSASADENIQEVLQSIYLDANELFGEDLEVLFQAVEIPESEKKYGLDLQITDMTDELLSTIPNSKRTKKVMDNINNLIEKFKQLRSRFSFFDENGNITGKKTLGNLYKPLVDSIKKLDTKLTWILPIAKIQKKTYQHKSDEKRGTVLEPTDDTILTENAEDLQNLYEIFGDYYKNAFIGDENKYDYLFSRIDQNMTPFLRSGPLNRNNLLLFNKEIKADLEVIVNNLGDYMSSAVKEEHIYNKRFLIQRMNLGLTRPGSIEMKGGQKIYIKVGVTPNDKLSIQSLLFLPEPFVKYSQKDLPGTNILMRSQLSQNQLEFFRLFKKTRDFNQKLIENFDSELDYEKMEADNKNDIFLSKITEFLLDETLYEDSGADHFAEFLNVVVPKIRVIIRLLKKQMKYKFSLVDIVKVLEPFLIYTDNISYGQYNEIRYLLKEKIKEYKQKLAEKSQKFSLYKNASFETKPGLHAMDKMFFEKKDIYDTFKELYEIKNGNSSSEILQKVLEKDNGNLFFTTLSALLLPLVTPNNLLDSLEGPAIRLEENTESGEQKKNRDVCIKRVLSKKYNSMRELQKDNNTEVYFDKEMDDTPYGILDKYKEEKKKMLPEVFIKFLAENLVQKHDCSRSNSMELANDLIMGKKQVKDGVYAILVLRPQLPKEMDETALDKKTKEEIEIEERVRTVYHYYVRRNNYWVKDDTINEEEFMDTNTLFCNIDFNCIKNKTTSLCETTENQADIMKKMANKRAIDEFDKRYTISVEEIKRNLEKMVNENKSLIVKKQLYKQNVLYKANFISYEIGKYANKDASLIQSPHNKLRDLILSQEDFTKKQQDIIRFVDDYCRESLPEQKEDAHWLYCKDTNTKLFPRSLLILAQAFLNNNFQERLEQLCFEIGELSDDGDSWVDKHSGYILRKIDFVSETGYDDTGFKITSHSIIEKDLGEVASSILEKKEKKIFEDETTDKVYNIFYTLCVNLDIPIEVIEDISLRFSMEIINNRDILLDEKSYQKRSEKLEKTKGKVLEPYKIYRDQTIITIVSCVLFIAIQTAIPSFKTRKTFPGCVRSFSGYPLEGGIEDTTGIRYLSCVIIKTKSSIEPWNSIQKLNAITMEKRIKEVIEKFILPKNEVIELYLKKKEYLLLNPEHTIANEVGISQKWKLFNPPIVSFSIVQKLKGTSAEFDKDFLEVLTRGNKTTRELLNVYISKNIEHSYGDVELINNIVRTKGLLLKTMTKIPFLENACCNEKAKNPLTYFTEENPEIELLNKRIMKNEILLNHNKQLITADIFYNDENTGLVSASIPAGIIELNIYEAFIHYCNLDNDIPIPDDLRVLLREKPAYTDYNKKMDTREKMEILKRHGKRFGVEELHQLMMIVNKRNRLDITIRKEVNPIQMLKDLLETLEISNSKIIEEPLRKLMGGVLHHYNPKVMIMENDKTQSDFNKSITKLNNYLIKTNEKMNTRMMDFLDGYGNLTTSEFNKLQEHILSITKWENDTSMLASGLYYEQSLYSIIEFIQNSIYNIAYVFPNSILNSASIGDKKAPKHWGFSDKHNYDIEKSIHEYYEELKKYQSNRVLNRLLQNIETKLVDVLLFLKNIPVYTPVVKEGILFNGLFEKRTVYLLYSYCWYSVFYEYILLAEDPEMLNIEKEETKKQRRANKEYTEDESNYLSASYERKEGETEEKYEYDDDLQTIEIKVGEQTELKNSVCSLLITFLNIEKKNKTIVETPYNDITKKNRRTKEQEKKSITDFFENMDKDERNIENMLKKYKMERWNVGLQKGVFMYDKDTYDKERDGQLARLYNDFENNELQNVEQNALDVEQLNALEERENEQLYDAEGIDIDGLDEDYNDGIYYQEDADREFGYE